jgi:hypothetical protein
MSPARLTEARRVCVCDSGPMGWHVGFRVGPFRYSAPIGQRRRVRRYVPQPQLSPPVETSVWAVVLGTLAILLVVGLCVGGIAWTEHTLP